MRPRSPTELLDASFRFLRAYYPSLVTVMAIVFLPQLLTRALLPESIGAPIAVVVALLSVPAATGAAFLAVSDAYLTGRIQPGDVLVRVRARILTLLAASIIQNVMIVIGFVLLFVPGFIALAWTFAAPAAVVLEGLDSADAIRRSRQLARGYVGHVLKTLVLAGLIYSALTLAFFIPVTMVFAAGSRAAEVTRVILQIVFYPLVAVATTLLYYDLRIRKEGLDIELMAAETGDPLADPLARPAGAR